jgi:DNA polymerase-4
VKSETRLNCSIGIGTSRLIAKVASDQAKPNGVLWIPVGEESNFLAPLEVRKIPGVGKVMEKNLHDIGIKRVGDLAKLEDSFLEERFGKWGLALAGKSRGFDSGGWFDEEIGTDSDPKSISHEHTFNDDTANEQVLESTLARLSEMVGRRLREHELHTHTIQLKLRYSDFSTITRAESLKTLTQLDTEIFNTVRALFRRNWKRGQTIRLLGVHAGSLSREEGQIDLINGNKNQRWKDALNAADKLRDKFGEGAVSLGTGMKASIREKTHEALPEKKSKQ